MLARQLSVKPPSTYPQEVVREIQLVSYNPLHMPTTLGSFSFRIQKYPADIDLMDDVSTVRVHHIMKPANNPEELILEFAHRLQEIVGEVLQQHSTYLLDFKCGLDERYILPIGNIDSGIFRPNPHLLSTLAELYITVDDFRLIEEMVTSKPPLNQDHYDHISNIIKKYYTIRWSARDIMAGKTKLQDGTHITLLEALHIKSLIKMDIATLIDGKFMEISNIFGLSYVDHNNKRVFLTPVQATYFIPFDIERLFYSNMWYAPFKVIKRMFSYGRLQYLHGASEYSPYLQQLTGIISGDVSLLYQIKSELDTIITLHELEHNPSPKSIQHQLEGMKNRLGSDLRLDTQTLEHLSNLLTMGALDDAAKILKTMINKIAIEFLNNIHANPIPDIYLPTREVVDMMNRSGQTINPLVVRQSYRTYKVTARQPLDHPVAMTHGPAGGVNVGDPMMSALRHLTTLINRVQKR